MTARAKQAEEEKLRVATDLELVRKEKTKVEAKLGAVSSKLSKLSSELGEEKQLNRSLRENQEEWQVCGVVCRTAGLQCY